MDIVTILAFIIHERGISFHLFMLFAANFKEKFLGLGVNILLSTGWSRQKVKGYNRKWSVKCTYKPLRKCSHRYSTNFI